jgi:hypothetical protein
MYFTIPCFRTAIPSNPSPSLISIVQLAGIACKKKAGAVFLPSKLSATKIRAPVMPSVE